MAKRLTVKQRIDKLIADAGGIGRISNENCYAMTKAESMEYFSRNPELAVDEEILESMNKEEDFEGVIRCSSDIFDRTAETQCDVFIVCTSCNGYDLDSFAKYYLNSDIRKEIDHGNMAYCTMEYQDIIDGLDLSSVKKTDEHQDSHISDFAGMFFAEMQWELGIPSGEVLEMFSIADIQKYFKDNIKEDDTYILWIGECIKYFIRKQFHLSCSGRREYHGDDYFGNWYSSRFTMEGKRFRSVGHYLAYKKALLFKDTHAAGVIFDTIDRKTIENLAIKNFDSRIWEQHKEGLMKQAVLEKFRQNKYLRWLLLDTGDSEIAWCDENDTVLGTGISVYNPAKYDREKWKGQNRLGQCLMEIREIMRSEKTE